MDTIVGIVIYQKAISYLEECLESLEKQSDKNFRIVLVNDDIPSEIAGEKLKKIQKDFPNEIILVDKYGQGLEPYLLRVELIKTAYREQADILIFLDCDDRASENRVECIRRQFDAEYTFFYNELLDFDGKPVMPPMPDYTTSCKAIGECNYLGMSNGAIHLRKLSSDFIETLNEGKTNIFDWYLYSRILLEVGKGKKIKGCYTYYRIHEGNVAGRSISSKDAVEKELAIKIRHYSLLREKSSYYKELQRKYLQAKPEDIIPEMSEGYWWSLINYHYV